MGPSSGVASRSEGLRMTAIPARGGGSDGVRVLLRDTLNLLRKQADDFVSGGSVGSGVFIGLKSLVTLAALDQNVTHLDPAVIDLRIDLERPRHQQLGFCQVG